MRKIRITDVVFIVGSTIALLLLNEAGQMELVQSYSVPILYASYLLGRLASGIKTNKPARKD
jgi:hypothetical protein